MRYRRARICWGRAREHGIRANTISPGLVSTPLTRSLTALPGVMNAYLERISAKHRAQPDEIASMAVLLPS
ncbi:SDR family oxidoreductase [Arthrobacter globiformis]|uniref:SDR family oxidoreductase n=1 Tax=Arthrobacter globiformis TaxID=1665 RepID=UPI00358EFEE5